jgi:FKBP-type peptidyl-prolyl cis-trans isomerase FkpA
MTPHRTLLAALCLALAACASVRTDTPETVTYAPALRVDLAAMQRLATGVYIRDLRTGEGEPARPGQHVAVHYAGWLPGGTQFDALAEPDPPIEFRLGAGEVIGGWDDGIRGMRAGGQRMIVVPPVLGYGSEGAAGVPPNAVLVFLVELVRIR